LSNSPRTAPAGASSGPRVDQATRLALFRSQLEIRLLEKRAYDLFLQNLIKGTSHLSLGQEAVAAGFAVAMRGDDYTFCTYRGHAHTLARGAPMAGVLGELMGRKCGLMGGKGGSMHLTSVRHGAMGSYAIVGAHLPVAAGAAWSAQVRGTDQVAVCFFGDGATNIGAFHEALNFAAVWKLPVIFVCENNQYMEYTPIRSVTAVEHPAADRASAYGLERQVVDGNDADAVYAAAAAAIGRARGGEGPSPGELEEWTKRDPIALYRARLLELGFEESELRAMDSAVQRAVDEATEGAKASPTPPLEVIDKDVWADGGSSWRN